MMAVYLAIIGAVGVVFVRLPSSSFRTKTRLRGCRIQLAAWSDAERTLGAVKRMEAYMLRQPESGNREHMGYSFTGAGRTRRFAFATSRTGPSARASSTRHRASRGARWGEFSQIRDASIYPLSPPPIPELGNASGFTFRLQTVNGLGHDALVAARNQLLGLASRSPALARRACRRSRDAPHS